MTAVQPVTVRPARANEIPALTTFPDDSERNASTAAYLELLLAKECTRPEWCLVADSDGRTDRQRRAVGDARPGHSGGHRAAGRAR